MIRFPLDDWTRIMKGFRDMQNTLSQDMHKTLPSNVETIKALLSFIKRSVSDYAANIPVPKPQGYMPPVEDEDDEDNKDDEEEKDNTDKDVVSLGDVMVWMWRLDSISGNIHGLMTRDECRRGIVEYETDEDHLEDTKTDNGACR
jgi:hypothetical protein